MVRIMMVEGIIHNEYLTTSSPRTDSYYSPGNCDNNVALMTITTIMVYCSGGAP